MKPIITAIVLAVSNAPTPDRDRVQYAIEESWKLHPRTYASLKRTPFVRELLDRLEELLDIRLDSGVEL